jgi:hypothetical protein
MGVGVKVLQLSLLAEVLAYNPNRAGEPLQQFFFDESWFWEDLTTHAPLLECWFHRDYPVKDILFAPANSETTHNLNFTPIRAIEMTTNLSTAPMKADNSSVIAGYDIGLMPLLVRFKTALLAKKSDCCGLPLKTITPNTKSNRTIKVIGFCTKSGQNAGIHFVPLTMTSYHYHCNPKLPYRLAEKTV